jgi:hypothetical protein
VVTISTTTVTAVVAAVIKEPIVEMRTIAADEKAMIRRTTG